MSGSVVHRHPGPLPGFGALRTTWQASFVDTSRNPAPSRRYARGPMAAGTSALQAHGRERDVRVIIDAGHSRLQPVVAEFAFDLNRAGGLVDERGARRIA